MLLSVVHEHTSSYPHSSRCLLQGKPASSYSGINVTLIQPNTPLGGSASDGEVKVLLHSSYSQLFWKLVPLAAKTRAACVLGACTDPEDFTQP